MQNGYSIEHLEPDPISLFLSILLLVQMPSSLHDFTDSENDSEGGPSVPHGGVSPAMASGSPSGVGVHSEEEHDPGKLAQAGPSESRPLKITVGHCHPHTDQPGSTTPMAYALLLPSAIILIIT